MRCQHLPVYPIAFGRRHESPIDVFLDLKDSAKKTVRVLWCGDPIRKGGQEYAI
jgi:hypothetical protein